MVEWVYKKLGEAKDKSVESLKTIVSDLLNELISPNHQETCKCNQSTKSNLFYLHLRGRRLRQHDMHPHCVQKVIERQGSGWSDIISPL